MTTRDMMPENRTIGNGSSFKEVNCNFDDVAVFVAETESNYDDSMSLLKQNGLEPLTHELALALASRYSELEDPLKGKEFYLAERRFNESGCHTFDDGGQISPDKVGKFFGANADMEEKVWCEGGKNPLRLSVLTDDDASLQNARFSLSANLAPLDRVSVVVGFKIYEEDASDIEDMLRTT